MTTRTGQRRAAFAPLRARLQWIYRLYLVAVAAATVVVPFALRGYGHAPGHDNEVLTGAQRLRVSTTPEPRATRRFRRTLRFGAVKGQLGCRSIT